MKLDKPFSLLKLENWIWFCFLESRWLLVFRNFWYFLGYAVLCLAEKKPVDFQFFFLKEQLAFFFRLSLKNMAIFRLSAKDFGLLKWSGMVRLISFYSTQVYLLYWELKNSTRVLKCVIIKNIMKNIFLKNFVHLIMLDCVLSFKLRYFFSFNWMIKRVIEKYTIQFSRSVLQKVSFIASDQVYICNFQDKLQLLTKVLFYAVSNFL